MKYGADATKTFSNWTPLAIAKSVWIEHCVMCFLPSIPYHWLAIHLKMLWLCCLRQCFLAITFANAKPVSKLVCQLWHESHGLCITLQLSADASTCTGAGVFMCVGLSLCIDIVGCLHMVHGKPVPLQKGHLDIVALLEQHGVHCWLVSLSSISNETWLR